MALAAQVFDVSAASDGVVTAGDEFAGASVAVCGFGGEVGAWRETGRSM